MKDTNNSFKRPEAIFIVAPEVQDVANEYGIDDPRIIAAMYEVYLRANQIGDESFTMRNEESYEEGYKDGYNDAIEAAINEIDDASWNVERLKKN